MAVLSVNLTELCQSDSFATVSFATVWHEENNLGHRQDDRRRLRATPESRRYHLAESSLNSFKCGARTRTYRSRERLETGEEKVTCA
jgi:hypothetical protein